DRLLQMPAPCRGVTNQAVRACHPTEIANGLQGSKRLFSHLLHRRGVPRVVLPTAELGEFHPQPPYRGHISQPLSNAESLRHDPICLVKLTEFEQRDTEVQRQKSSPRIVLTKERECPTKQPCRTRHVFPIERALAGRR